MRLMNEEKIKIEKRSIEEISRVLAHTDDENLIRRFLESLLTPSELEEIGSRWALVKLIDSGMSQRKIAGKLRLSLCKITRGSKELKKKNSAFAAFIHKLKELK